jgi:CBS domain containing-hemolysin-like protein
VNVVSTLIVGLLIVLAILGSFTCESLRGFSRSRLDEACWRLGRRERLGVILRRSTEAFLAAGLVTVVFLVLLAALAGVRVTNELAHEVGASRWVAALTEPIVAIAGFVLVFFLFPWCLARVTGERFLARVWPALEVLIRFTTPYLALARRLDAFMHRLWGLKEPGESNVESMTREIKSVIELGQREGILASQSRRMIERVIALQQEDVAAVMTPRTDMDCIEAAASLEEARRRMIEAGHSRMPVIGASTDDIIGILYAKDLLRHVSDGANGDDLHLKDVVREPFYVPETTGIDKLLESMKRRRVHIAIVLDEYSGVAGLVTMEDVLEQIVGEIVDEYDTAEDTGIRQTAPGSVEVASWVRIDDLDEQFGFDFPDDEDYDTIGGFIYAQLGRVPKKRDTLNWKQLRLTVLDADKRRIDKIRIDAPASQAVRSTEPG